MQVHAVTQYQLLVSQQELTLIGRALAGLVTKVKDLREAAELNVRLAEQVERIHQDRAEVTAGASDRAAEILAGIREDGNRDEG